jgi:hypothetical protein
MDCSQTKLLLQKYYDITTEDLPTQRPKSEWKPHNKFGFFVGIVQEGDDQHVTLLNDLLNNNKFTEQQEFSSTTQLANPQHSPTFIDIMFAYYILPFHKNYSDSSSCHTPASSRPPSRANSVENVQYVTVEKELSHKDLKVAVEMRDGVCLFCWNRIECEGAHIIAQKNTPMAYNEVSIFTRAGLSQKHQVQNGLLLCKICHSQFDKLKRYVDADGDKLVVKVVNETNDETSNKHKEWKDNVRMLKLVRSGWQENWTDIDNRQAVETNGEMALYFVQNDPTTLPNRNALEFHKAACLIWRMAGGAEMDEEYCSDDEDLGPVDTAALKRRFKVQDSAETINIVS